MSTYLPHFHSIAFLFYCGFLWTLLLLVHLCGANDNYSFSSASCFINATNSLQDIRRNASASCGNSSHSGVDSKSCSSLASASHHHIETALYVGYLESAYVDVEEDKEKNTEEEAIPHQVHGNSRETVGTSVPTHASVPSPAVLLSMSRRYYLHHPHHKSYSRGRSAASAPSWQENTAAKRTRRRSGEERMTREHDTVKMGQASECLQGRMGEEEEEEAIELPSLLAILNEARSQWGLDHTQISSCGGQWHPIWSTGTSARAASAYHAKQSPSSSSPTTAAGSTVGMPTFDDLVHTLANHAECTLPSLSVCGGREDVPAMVSAATGTRRSASHPHFSTEDPLAENPTNGVHHATPSHDPLTLPSHASSFPLPTTVPHVLPTRPGIHREEDALAAVSFWSSAILGYTSDPLFFTSPAMYASSGAFRPRDDLEAAGLPGQLPRLWRALPSYRWHTFSTVRRPPSVFSHSPPLSSHERTGEATAPSSVPPVLPRERTSWCVMTEVPSGGPLCSSLLSRLLGVEEDEEDDEGEGRTSSSFSSQRHSTERPPFRLLSAEQRLFAPFRLLFGPWSHGALVGAPFLEISVRWERVQKESFMSRGSFPSFAFGEPWDAPMPTREDSPTANPEEDDDDVMLEIRLSVVLPPSSKEEEENPLSYWVAHFQSEKVQALLRWLSTKDLQDSRESSAFAIHVGPKGAPPGLRAALSPWLADGQNCHIHHRLPTGSPAAPLPLGVHLSDMYVHMTHFPSSPSVWSFFTSLGRLMLGTEVQLYDAWIELEVDPVSSLPTLLNASSASIESFSHRVVLLTWISFPLSLIHPFFQHFNPPLPSWMSTPISVTDTSRAARTPAAQTCPISSSPPDSPSFFSSSFFPISHSALPPMTAGRDTTSSFPFLSSISPFFSSGGGSGGAVRPDHPPMTHEKGRGHVAGGPPPRRRSPSPPPPLMKPWRHTSSAPSSSTAVSGRKRYWIASPFPTENRMDEPMDSSAAGVEQRTRHVALDVSWQTALVESRVEEEGAESGVLQVLLATTVEVVGGEGQSTHGSHTPPPWRGKEGEKKVEANAKKTSMDRLPEWRAVRTALASPTELEEEDHPPRPRPSASSPSPLPSRPRRQHLVLPIRIASIPYLPVWPSTRHFPPSSHRSIRLPSPQAMVLQMRHSSRPSFRVDARGSNGTNEKVENSKAETRRAGGSRRDDVFPVASLPPLLAVARHVCPLLQERATPPPWQVARPMERPGPHSPSDGCPTGHDEDTKNSDFLLTRGSPPSTPRVPPTASPPWGGQKEASYPFSFDAPQMDHDVVLFRWVAHGVCPSLQHFLSVKDDPHPDAVIPAACQQWSTPAAVKAARPFSWNRELFCHDASPFDSRVPPPQTLSTRRFRGKPMRTVHNFDVDLSQLAPMLYIFLFCILFPIAVMRMLSYVFVL